MLAHTHRTIYVHINSIILSHHPSDDFHANYVNNPTLAHHPSSSCRRSAPAYDSSARESRASCLHTPPALHSSIPLYPYDCSASPDLQSSVPLCLHVCTPAVRHHTSSSTRLQCASSTSPGPQHASRALHLCSSFVATPTSRL